jgi:anti-sigma factor RsiW
MTVPTAHELMMLADGELAPERRAEVEAWLSKSDVTAAAESVEAIRQVGDFVRSYAESTTRQFDVAEEVMARIATADAGQSGSSTASGTNVRRLARRRSRAGAFLGFASFAIAAAAAAVVWLSSRHSAVDAGKPRAALSAVGIPLSPDPESQESGVEDPGGASILAVDFGTQNGSIFMVNAGHDVTPVVWLLDDSGESGDRMEPL